MLQRISRSLCAGAVLGTTLLLTCGSSFAQQAAPAAAAPAGIDPDSDAGVIARLGGQRDEFLRAVVEAGDKPCTPPKIELGDPLAYGEYHPKTNTLVMGAWTHLSAAERQSFEDMAQ